MPPLLNAASAKANVSVYDEEEDGYERDGWETISMDGQIAGIRTSTIDEKCEAFDTIVIHCSVLGGRFGPYFTQSLELTLPALQFYFHEGVREAACRFIPLLTSCGKQSGTLIPPMVTASLSKLIYCIQIETDPSFVASLYKAIADTLRVAGLQNMAEKRKRRSVGNGVGGVAGPGGGGGTTSTDPNPSTPHYIATDEDDRDEIALMEKMEEFTLEDMEKALRMLDGQHPLLIAIASVRKLGCHRYPWEGEEEGLRGPGDVQG
ncbi:hypothetical protein L210DRAFT_989820 [Boletus edulis BED1]|uniref:Uncharacterized protein n=1 Tax=Boletus edulis BED1 TaxID=1328754 RepID=A0AAD4BHG8_BOLED|nr:hypothetical protein L210DRAFT_989820 [Boletus edulis BED1]